MGLFVAFAVVRKADVMIGTHGANMFNAFMMRPQTSFIEILTEEVIPMSFGHAYNSWDSESEVMMWGLVVKVSMIVLLCQSVTIFCTVCKIMVACRTRRLCDQAKWRHSKAAAPACTLEIET